ncbi:MAG: zinc ribbon domain-containing protein [Bacillota bacterium]|nr:zinc ribbon domain-containing protein [Bacillota bacterium]
MFCENCGFKLDDGLLFCPNCGVRTQNLNTDENKTPQPENHDLFIDQCNTGTYIQNIPSTTPIPKKRFTKKLVLICSILVIVLAAGCFGIYAFTSDMFKSTKSIYLEIESKNIMKSINSVRSSLKDNYNENIKPLLEKKHETKTKLSLDMDLSSIPGIDSSAAPQVSKLLKNIDLTIDTKSNPLNEQSITNLALNIKNNKFIAADIIQNKNRLAASIPDLYNKYLTLDKKDINKFLDNIGLNNNMGTNIPSKFLSGLDIYNAIKVDDKELDGLLREFGKVMEESIQDNQITEEDDVAIKVNDLNINCRKFTLNLDESTVKSIILKLVDTAGQNEAFYNLTVKNILNILKLYEDAGYNIAGTGDNKLESILSKDNFKKGMSSFRDQLKSALKDVSIPGGLKMSIYAKGHTIIGRTLDATIKTSDSEEGIKLDLNYNGVSNYNSRNISNLELKLSSPDTQSDMQELDLRYSYDTTISKDIESGNASLVVDGKGNSLNRSLLKADIKINKSSTDTKSQKYTYNYDISFGMPEQASITGAIDINTWQKNKEKTSGRDIKLSYDYKPDLGPKLKGSININTETTLDTNFKLPDINSSNSVDIGNADQNELSSIGKEITNSLQDFLLKKQDLLRILGEFGT